MSKYSECMGKTYKNIGKLRDATKSMINDGKDIVFKEFHEANSVERLKRCIREGK